MAFVFAAALVSPAWGTVPLTLDQWKDCITNNSGGYDTDCVLQSGDYTISSTIWVWRSNITIRGAWPWPMLRRAVGFTQDLMLTATPTSWINIKDIYFHGNRWNGATSVASELNLTGCSYCQVNANALFIGSPNYALNAPPNVPIAVGYVNFQGNRFAGIFAGSAPECYNPIYWYPNVCLNVAGSYFYNDGVGSIGPAPKNARIVANTFTGNHSECGYNSPGGQIDLDDGADKITVSNNTFENGPSCANGWWAVGVELHGTNITLTDNIIRYNAGDGVYMDGASYVTVNSTNPASYPISNNNRRGSGNFCGGGFPGIAINAGSYLGRPNHHITLNNLWSISGHTYGVLVRSCNPGATPNYSLTITNNCVAGNLYGGVHDAMNCGPGQNQSCLGSGSYVNNNPTSGCGGY